MELSLASALVREATRQSDLAEGVSRAQCSDARVAGIPLALLAHVQSGDEAGREESAAASTHPRSSTGTSARSASTRRGRGRRAVSKPFLLRYSNVFNLSQMEGIDLPESALQETRTNNPIEECERIVSGMPNRPAVEQSDKAWYAPAATS